MMLSKEQILSGLMTSGAVVDGGSKGSFSAGLQLLNNACNSPLFRGEKLADDNRQSLFNFIATSYADKALSEEEEQAFYFFAKMAVILIESGLNDMSCLQALHDCEASNKDLYVIFDALFVAYFDNISDFIDDEGRLDPQVKALAAPQTVLSAIDGLDSIEPDDIFKIARLLAKLRLIDLYSIFSDTEKMERITNDNLFSIVLEDDDLVSDEMFEGYWKNLHPLAVSQVLLEGLAGAIKVGQPNLTDFLLLVELFIDNNNSQKLSTRLRLEKNPEGLFKGHYRLQQEYAPLFVADKEPAAIAAMSAARNPAGFHVVGSAAHEAAGNETPVSSPIPFI